MRGRVFKIRIRYSFRGYNKKLSLYLLFGEIIKVIKKI